MSVLSNIEFSILNSNLVKETEDSKKIKFKHESYLKIREKYDSFCIEAKEKELPKFSNSKEPVAVQSTPGMENVVVHIKNRTYEKKESQQDKLKEQVYILKIAGTLLPQFVGRRALKIKDTMKNNMLENNRKACEDKVKEELPVQIVPEEPKEREALIPETIKEPAIETIPDVENIKVSKNGTTTAKIAKYNEQDELDTKTAHTESNDEVKPVSDVITVPQPKEKFKFTIPQIKIETLPHKISDEVKFASDINTTSNVVKPISEEKKPVQSNESKVAVASLKDSLTKANQLKEELERAKKNAEKAKADAEMAKAKADAEKRETEMVQEQLVATMKKLEEHNRRLEEEKKINEEEAKKYAAESQEYIEQGKEYSSMQEEYKQTINEMLAIIG